MRGEGNHKIPGSFAPENMKKTGAERVKYSLACQHEDAISIKFVSYAQKCPTVLCTFAVALRKESVDRNLLRYQDNEERARSLSARRAWIEIQYRDCVGGLIWRSLSARRAWIEISDVLSLHTETIRSLSARRAWIEMAAACRPARGVAASLSARRAWIEMALSGPRAHSRARRSPQGERG